MNPQDLAAFNQAVSLAQAGNKQPAYQMLVGLQSRYPTNTNVLLWLAFTTPNFQEAERAVYDAGRANPQDPAVVSAQDWLAAQRVRQESIAPPQPQQVVYVTPASQQSQGWPSWAKWMVFLLAIPVACLLIYIALYLLGPSINQAYDKATGHFIFYLFS